MHTLRVGNDQIKYSVRENAGSKYVQLRFRPNLELEISIPSGGHIDVRKVIEKKQSWIQRNYEEIASSRRVFDGKRVLFKGIRYNVAFNHGATKPRVQNTRLVLPLREDEHPQAALQRWMSNETRKFIQRRFGKYRSKFRLSFKDFSVSNTRRWAYCTKDGQVVFNWRLSALPTELADYVVLHEINHLREFNHSQSFRYALASVCPDFKEKQARLRSYLVD
ncbi:MAG: YgjP-like metallopeptidase domain-containing protein [Candidatus Bathyarchaeia archaeon]|jgi:predicted metal-dependent hydrolase